MTALRYLAGYPPQVLEQAAALLSQGRLRDTVARRHPERPIMRLEMTSDE